VNEPLALPNTNPHLRRPLPERRLLAAIVLQAVVDLAQPPHISQPKHRRRQRAEARDAAEFLFDSPWGLKLMEDYLDIDVERFREGLRAGRVPGDLASWSTSWNVNKHLARRPAHVRW